MVFQDFFNVLFYYSGYDIAFLFYRRVKNHIKFVFSYSLKVSTIFFGDFHKTHKKVKISKFMHYISLFSYSVEAK